MSEYSPDVEERIIDVTPQMAAEWLLLNTNNRPIRSTLVATYAGDMSAEPPRWVYTGDPIRFATMPDGTEKLIDGQHRLAAVVRAKRTVPMRVIRGLTPETQRFVDIGARRQLADQLTLEGFAHGKSLSALARRIHAYRQTGAPSMRATAVSLPVLRDVLIDPETGQVVPLIAAAAEYAHRHPRGLIPASGLGFLFWLLVPLGNEYAVEFLDRSDDGAGLDKDEDGRKDPILAWRDRVIDMRRDGVKVNDYVTIAFGIIAWNLRCEGKKVKHLRKLPGGITVKNYPQPIRPTKSALMVVDQPEN